MFVQKYRVENGWTNTTESELSAFIAYAYAYPDSFLALIDTYDTLQSGVYNYLSVALALCEIGYKPIGVRIDSGDLAYISKELRKIFILVDNKYSSHEYQISKTTIVASNDICTKVLFSLNDQHEIDMFGIGTHLVTCKSQPALGMVFKLVEIDGHPRIKLSEQSIKVTFPGKKNVYRLFLDDQTTGNKTPFVDLICTSNEPIPKFGEKILCKHPVDITKRVYITPTKIQPLHITVWDGLNAITVNLFILGHRNIIMHYHHNICFFF